MYSVFFFKKSASVGYYLSTIFFTFSEYFNVRSLKKLCFRASLHYMEFMHSQLHFELVLLHVHVHLNGSITYNRLGLHTSKLIYVLIREIFHFQKAPKMRSLFDIYNFAI